MNLAWLPHKQRSEAVWFYSFLTVLLLILGLLVWSFSPHWKAIYSSSEATVEYREMGPNLQIHVTAASNIFPKFLFDYWQDGLREGNDPPGLNKSKAEPSYAVEEDGAICTQYRIFDSSAAKNGSTICGGLVSSAIAVDFTRDATRWGYTMIVPKKELSSSGESASMVIDFWNKATQGSSSYPTARFAAPVHITYRRNLSDLTHWIMEQ